MDLNMKRTFLDNIAEAREDIAKLERFVVDLDLFDNANSYILTETRKYKETFNNLEDSDDEDEEDDF